MIKILKKILGMSTTSDQNEQEPNQTDDSEKIAQKVKQINDSKKIDQKRNHTDCSEQKDRANTTQFKTKVAGVGRRQSHLKRWSKKIDAGDVPDITLVREPENKHDPNAIKVILNEYSERTGEKKESHIGYIRAHVAASLAVDMDRGSKVDCWFDDIIGGEDGLSYGMLITVEIDGSFNIPAEPVTAETDADFSTPTPMTAKAAEKRYFYLLNRIRTSEDAHCYQEMLQSCRESIPLLKGLVKATKAEYGSFDITSILAISVGCLYWPAIGDTKSLAFLAATVDSIPEIKKGWGDAVILAQKRAVLGERILSYITDHPGTIQSSLRTKLDVTGDDVRALVYYMERMGRVRREKSGRSYKLYILGANFSE